MAGKGLRIVDYTIMKISNNVLAAFTSIVYCHIKSSGFGQPFAYKTEPVLAGDIFRCRIILSGA